MLMENMRAKNTTHEEFEFMSGDSIVRPQRATTTTIP
jgi:hypothetical protein